MFTRRKEILKGNVAFMPLVFLVALFGFHLENAKKNKIFRLLHSVTLLIVLFLVSPFIVYNLRASGVVATIAYINARCIYWTLIMIYMSSLLPGGKSLLSVFKCFDNIDLKLVNAFDMKIKERGDSKQRFIPVMLLLLTISAFSSFAFECWKDKMFNVGQFIHATIVFVLSVKISFYCTLCTSIKARFQTLIKCLKDSESRHTSLEVKCVASKLDVSHIKEISLIYDEALEIIEIMNDSFSTLLGAAFGEMNLYIYLLRQRAKSLNPMRLHKLRFDTFSFTPVVHAAFLDSLFVSSNTATVQTTITTNEISSRNNFPLLHIECILHSLHVRDENFYNFPAD